MARVQLHGIRKTFAEVRALDAVSLDIASGEFFTLLGPSGCGKTTLLRTIAGFVQQDEGDVLLGDQVVDHLPAHRRDTGMVFQDYAIFPHLSVGGNVAFGLRNRGVARSEFTDRVEHALHTVRLSGYADRMPHELSGGQQQRVGLARAMVIRPSVLLMDEPLSNLDAKLRVELREDIRDIQRELGITTIYVTHDQEEALVVSDRVCVMRDGTVEQIGTPWEVYKQPATRFVAAFVGSMNFIQPWPDEWPAPSCLGARGLAGRVVAIRPEDINLVDRESSATDGHGVVTVDACVAKVSFTGREAQYLLRTAQGTDLVAHVQRPERSTLAALGSEVRVALPESALQLFDAQTWQRI
jgi:iron(III) transport system ATP-binding protein